jgi:pSer/pThr/pTyr-binding forkhead associated (FHA) protein
MRIINIGRASDNDIVINDPMVGRRYCQITVDDNGNMRLTDLGSVNGTFVNGRRISGEVSINRNDIVRIGNTTLSLQTIIGHPLDNELEEIGKNSPLSPLPRATAMCYASPPETFKKKESLQSSWVKKIKKFFKL